MMMTDGVDADETGRTMGLGGRMDGRRRRRQEKRKEKKISEGRNRS